MELYLLIKKNQFWQLTVTQGNRLSEHNVSNPKALVITINKKKPELKNNIRKDRN